MVRIFQIADNVWNEYSSAHCIESTWFFYVVAEGIFFSIFPLHGVFVCESVSLCQV